MILNFNEACRYPFSHSEELPERIALEESVSKNHIVLTGGSTESLKVVELTYVMNGGEIIAAKPTFLAVMTHVA